MSLPNRLNELLLDCLGHLLPDQWPGGEGFTKEDVLHEYPALADRRLVPGEDTLHRLHPELAAELARFFTGRTSQQGAETGVEDARDDRATNIGLSDNTAEGIATDA